MTNKFRVKTAAVIDNNPVGSIIELPKKTAESLAAKKYVEIIEEIKSAKKESAPKKQAKKSSTKKDKK